MKKDPPQGSATSVMPVSSCAPQQRRNGARFWCQTRNQTNFAHPVCSADGPSHDPIMPEDLEDELGVAGKAGAEVGGERDGLVEGVCVKGLSPAEDCCHSLRMSRARTTRGGASGPLGCRGREERGEEGLMGCSCIWQSYGDSKEGSSAASPRWLSS